MPHQQVACTAIDRRPPIPAEPLSMTPPTAPPELEVLQALHRELECDALLACFARHGVEWVGIDGLHYSDAATEFEFDWGRNAQHVLEYRLSLEEKPLGRLQLRRSHPFSEAEAQQTESLIGALLFPLRNALRYRRAVLGALTDALTGIGNRNALELTLDREVSIVRRHGGQTSVALIDADHFKRVNDTHGHLTGDRVLKTLVKEIIAAARKTDLLFRFGGEEFVLLLDNTDEVGAAVIAERIRAAVAEADFSGLGLESGVTVSVGTATLTDADSPESLLARADRALYAAKAAGRNRVQAAPWLLDEVPA